MLTGWGMFSAAAQRRASDAAHLQHLADRAAGTFRERLWEAKLVLASVDALLSPDDASQPEVFREAYERMEMRRRLPCVQGMGLVRRVAGENQSRVLAELQAEGRNDFKVTGHRPAADGADRYVVVCREPGGGDAAAMGLDLAREPVRKEAADRAWATGRPTLSGPVRLVSERSTRPGLLYLSPFGTDTPGETNGEAGCLRGWFYLVLRMDRLCDEAAASTAGEATVTVADAEGGSEPDGRSSAHRLIVAGGRTFTLRVDAARGFQAASASGFFRQATGGSAALVLLFALSLIGRRRPVAPKQPAVADDLIAGPVDSLDALTGLPDRPAIEQRIGDALARNRACPDHSFAVLFLDFDRFKQINDSLGHRAGDELLSLIGERLRDALRCDDGVTLGRRGGRDNAAMPARLGGDEFLVLLDGLTHAGDGVAAAERLLRELAAPYTVAGREVESQASIGVVHGGSRHPDAAAVIADADAAMVRAKERGRNCVVAFDARMHARSRALEAAASGVPEALASGRIELRYRPLVRLACGTTARAAAELHRNAATRTLLTSEESLNAARRGPYGASLAQWSVQRTLAEWSAFRGPSEEGLPVSVPVTCDQLMTPGLGDLLFEALSTYGVSAPTLRLEVLDRPNGRNEDAVFAGINALEHRGIRIGLAGGWSVLELLWLHGRVRISSVTVAEACPCLAGGTRAPDSLVRETLVAARACGIETVLANVADDADLALARALGFDAAEGPRLGSAMTGPALRARMRAGAAGGLELRLSA